jgi:Phage integrase, N-terminal SAM-like domain
VTLSGLKGGLSRLKHPSRMPHSRVTSPAIAGPSNARAQPREPPSRRSAAKAERGSSRLQRVVELSAPRSYALSTPEWIRPFSTDGHAPILPVSTLTSGGIAMTALRKSMIACLQLRGLSERTQEMYVRAVRQLAEHYHTSPALITEEEL